MRAGSQKEYDKMQLEKQHFERWARQRGMNTERRPDGGYWDGSAHAAALAWTHRARLADMAQWVSRADVYGRYPQPFQPLLFYAGESVVEAGFFDGRSWQNLSGLMFADDDVMYWQPFPDIPYGPIWNE